MSFYDSSGTSGDASGPQRKVWDTAEYEEKAKDRLKTELDAEEVRLGNKRKEEPKIRRDLLQARDYKVDLEGKVGKAVVINKATPSAESGGFYCDVCDCVMKDSINFLDHINGKNHQRNMGMSMKVKKSTLDDVKARFAFKKQEKDKVKKDKQMEELLVDVNEEEAKLRDAKRDKKKEDRKRKADPTEADELDPDLQAMMGFGGFAMMNLMSLVIFSFLVVGLGCATPSTLDEKVQQLQDMMYRQPVVKMNMDRWRNFVRQQPRNYSIMVLFTALSSSVNCPICKPAYDEFVIAANSHRFQNSDLKSLYFGVVDYEDAPQIFQQMNLNTAPIMYHFGPKTQGKKKPEQMDFQRHGFDADAIARFVADQTEVQIRILRPPNYAAPIIILLVVALILGLLYMKRNNLEFLYNKNFWGGICLLFTFIFMSGQMWNHIRGPPFVMTNPNTKETSFIHGSTQYQLVAETYIVALLYGLITAGFILMNNAADEGKSDRKKKPLLPGTAMVWLGLGMVVIFFSLLLSIFRSKYRGYPYSFLFS